MARLVRQANVLSEIIKIVASEFDCPIYSDEVVENFQKPCFFVSASSAMKPQTKNWVKKELTVELIYFSADGAKNEVAYMDVVDRLQQCFCTGIKAGDRYFHFESVDDSRVGEENDILSVTMVIPFIEQVAKTTNDNAELMGEVDLTFRTKYDSAKGSTSEEVWRSNINSDTV